MDVMLIVEDPTVSVKCRTNIKALFLYFNFSFTSFRITWLHIPWLIEIWNTRIPITHANDKTDRQECDIYIFNLNKWKINWEQKYSFLVFNVDMYILWCIHDWFIYGGLFFFNFREETLKELFTNYDPTIPPTFNEGIV